MSDGAVKQTMKRGVGRQIFAFFLAAAIIPMVFTAGLAWHEFNRGLETESSRALKGVDQALSAVDQFYNPNDVLRPHIDALQARG